MQGDGNLVEYNAANAAIWASGTSGNAGAYLVMQGDGNLVLYSAAHAALWASGTSGAGAYLELGDDGSLNVESNRGAAVVGYQHS